MSCPEVVRSMSCDLCTVVEQDTIRTDGGAGEMQGSPSKFERL